MLRKNMYRFPYFILRVLYIWVEKVEIENVYGLDIVKVQFKYIKKNKRLNNIPSKKCDVILYK